MPIALVSDARSNIAVQQSIADAINRSLLGHEGVVEILWPYDETCFEVEISLDGICEQPTADQLFALVTSQLEGTGIRLVTCIAMRPRLNFGITFEVDPDIFHPRGQNVQIDIKILPTQG